MRELTYAECEAVTGGHGDHEHTEREKLAEEFAERLTGQEHHCVESGTNSDGNIVVTCTPV
jgi:hypothetical protein